jgi:hypothetical protein
MAQQYLRITKSAGLFNGIDTNSIPSNGFVKMSNVVSQVQTTPSTAYSTPVPGVFYKGLDSSNYSTAATASAVARGLLPYYGITTTTTTINNALILAQRGTTTSTCYMYVPATTTWTTLAEQAGAGKVSSYPLDSAQFYDKLYICASNGIRKVWRDSSGTWDSILANAVDKGGSGVAIAGATLTWNGTATVTSDIDISALIYPGDWIRRSSTSAYWDEVKTVAVGGLSITLMANSSDNGASAAGGAQRADRSINFGGWAGLYLGGQPYLSLFMKVFKDKLFTARSSVNRLWWSVTGDPENWTGTGGGFMDIDIGDGDRISGLGVLGDYFFVFKNTKYYVYKYIGDVDSPLELVNVVYNGCPANRTIVPIEGYLGYLSQGEYRLTNGINDVSIGAPLFSYFSGKNYGITSSSYYFQLATTDSKYPCALYDETSKFLLLNFPGDNDNAEMFIYDFKEQKWAGVMNSQKYGQLVPFLSTVTTTIPSILDSQNGSTDRIKLLSWGTNDTDVADVISAPIDFGIPDEYKKVYWIEVEFLIEATCNTNVTLKWWDAASNSLSPTKKTSMSVNLTEGTGVMKTQIYRFPINDSVRRLQYELLESGIAAGNSQWGVNYITICYEPTETT